MAAVTPKGYPYPDPTDPDKPRLDIEDLARKIDEVPGIRAVTQADRDLIVDMWPGMVIFNLTTLRLEVNQTGTGGDWAWVIDAKQPVPISAGGTGRNVAPSLLVNLESTAATSPLSDTPRPGVTGKLPVANGGHGASTPEGARAALGVLSAEAIGEPETDFVAAFNAALSS